MPWAAHGPLWFTQAFADEVAYLVRYADFTTIAALARTTPRSVARIVTPTLARERSDDGLDGLTVIGIDEIVFRLCHRYLAVVVDHTRRRVVWAARGHDKATVRRFFEALGAKRIAKQVVLGARGDGRAAVGPSAAPRPAASGGPGGRA